MFVDVEDRVFSLQASSTTSNLQTFHKVDVSMEAREVDVRSRNFGGRKL